MMFRRGLSPAKAPLAEPERERRERDRIWQDASPPNVRATASETRSLLGGSWDGREPLVPSRVGRYIRRHETHHHTGGVGRVARDRDRPGTAVGGHARRTHRRTVCGPGAGMRPQGIPEQDRPRPELSYGCEVAARADARLLRMLRLAFVGARPLAARAPGPCISYGRL